MDGARVTVGTMPMRAKQSVKLIGRSAEIAALEQEVNRVASSDTKVLITGETGVGKEVVALNIHARGPRAGMPFAPVNCAACGIEAMVKKNSQKHTSVQWTTAGVGGCPEISAARAANPNGLILGCPKLTETIADAVRDGTVVVPDA